MVPVCVTGLSVWPFCVALCSAPLLRAELVGTADWCRSLATTMRVVYTGNALASAVALAAIPIAVLAARAVGGFDSESLETFQ
eukprot:scaffold113327_cov66-Phaeocystis_antarctica.AAC.7